jgi:hypothetical protein
MFRSFYLLVAVASLAGAMFFASAGSRPHQLYAETWQSQTSTGDIAPAPVR